MPPSMNLNYANKVLTALRVKQRIKKVKRRMSDDKGTSCYEKALENMHPNRLN